MTLSPTPMMVVAAGMAIPLASTPIASVALPAGYYAQADSADTDAPGTGKAAPPVSQAQLQDELDSALQKSGLRTEIENEKSGLMIVRFVEADTGAVVLQLPSQTVLDLIAGLTNPSEKGSSALAGHLLDQNA